MASAHGLLIDSTQRLQEVIGLLFGADALLLTEFDVGADFFRLESGIAGELFQRLANYKVKTAFVCADPAARGPRFLELAREHALHPSVRFFRAETEAVQWLTAGDADASMS